MPQILTETKRIKIKRASNCAAPLYVRWINKLGGVGYWLFDSRKTLTFRTSNEKQFMPYINDIETDQAIVETLSKDAVTRVLLFADQLDANDVIGLRGMLESPFVTAFVNDENFRLGEDAEWERIQVDTGSFELGDTGRGSYTFSVEVTLQPNIGISQ